MLIALITSTIIAACIAFGTFVLFQSLMEGAIIEKRMKAEEFSDFLAKKLKANKVQISGSRIDFRVVVEHDDGKLIYTPFNMSGLARKAFGLSRLHNLKDVKIINGDMLVFEFRKGI